MILLYMRCTRDARLAPAGAVARAGQMSLHCTRARVGSRTAPLRPSVAVSTP